MKKLVLLLVIIISMASFQKAKASHIAGGDISYVCLGANQYQIYLNLFVDCVGFDPGASQLINFASTCGGSTTATVNVTNPGGTEISQLCPSMITSSTCSGGTLPGMWVFHFEGIVTLAPPCDTWTMNWTVCCRNAAILNLNSPASFGSYIEATLNSATAACNNSPAFTAQPIPYVCQGQLVNYNYGVVETDGDSLHYSLIGAMDAGAAPLAYSAGYSAAVPIPGISIDPNTGTLTFTPMTLGNFVVVVLVQEYDSAGNLIGTTMRDIQFIVQSCSNVVPDPAPVSGSIASLTGGLQTGPYSVDLCEGDSVSFSASFSDSDASDTLNVISNILSVMPGATITITGVNPITVTIGWTAPLGSSGTNTTFSITVSDDACPVPGQQIFSYDVNVVTRTLAGPDGSILCGAQTVGITATGGSIFNWSVLSGPPLVVGTNFSCNPCDNPVASPTATTVYLVTSNLPCLNMDTVTVTVVPDFSFTTTQSASTTCLLQPISLSVNAVPAGAYIYSWSPAAYLSSTSIANPVATLPTPGTHTYYVTITSPMGCVKTDTVNIVITPNYPPVSIPFVSPNPACDGDNLNLGVTFGSTPPSVCAVSVTGPCSSMITSTVGTGALVGALPTPFSGFYEDARMQMLFTASELLGAGVTGGKISSLAFDVATKASTIPYNGFTVKMTCTNATALTPATFVPGAVTVYGPSTVNSALGWNTLNFTSAYEWDGISNLIVEICFDNAAWTNDDAVRKTNMGFLSTVHMRMDGVVGCTMTTGLITNSNERPNVRFGTCAASADTTMYSYAWSPSPLTNPSGQFTSATSNGNTTYTVVVTNSVSGCADTSSIAVTSSSPTVTFTANPTTGFYPLTVNFTSSTSSGVTGIVWNFGDTLSGTDNTSFFTNPSHVYNTEGSYTVTVIVTDANGCTDTATATIDVFGTSVMFVPNVFTPGGVNPQFVVTGFAINSYSIEIFNRWGKRVFQSTDILNSWDGNNVEDGTYFYMIKATGQDAKDYSLSGFVQRIGAK